MAQRQYSGREASSRHCHECVGAIPTDSRRASSGCEAVPQVGFLRLSAVLAPAGPIPVSRSTWYAGIRDGRYPAPVKLGPRISAWRAEDIRTLIKELADSR
jgi:predicted DNA-binding transcriptional regulator AlpA